jgi:peroxiredoxin
MKHLFLVSILSVFFVTASISHALNTGDKAPLFDAESSQGTVSLESFGGKKNVILAFYFADFSPV